MTTVLYERAAAPADPSDPPAAQAASPRPSPAAAPPAAEPTRVPAPRRPAAEDSPARPARLVRRGPDGVATLRFAGVLDRPGVARLAAALDGTGAHGADPVDLDLSGVTHVDGQGARALLGQSYLLEGGGGLRLHNAPRRVRRALRFYGAGHLLHR